MPGIKIVYGDGREDEYIPDPRSLEEQKEQKVAELADRRWNACQYFTYDGERTQADGAISAITGAVVGRQFAQQAYGVEPPPQIWKLNSKAFRTFTTMELVQFGFAAQGHISACFEREQQLSTAIEAATTGEELDLIDLGGWPGE